MEQGVHEAETDLQRQQKPAGLSYTAYSRSEKLLQGNFE